MMRFVRVKGLVPLVRAPEDADIQRADVLEIERETEDGQRVRVGSYDVAEAEIYAEFDEEQIAFLRKYLQPYFGMYYAAQVARYQELT